MDWKSLIFLLNAFHMAYEKTTKTHQFTEKFKKRRINKRRYDLKTFFWW
jgi:hypothetical protein